MPFVPNKASSSKSKTKSPKQAADKDGAQRLKTNAAKRARIDAELKELQARVDTFQPAGEIKLFGDLPLSSRTLKGLKSCHFLHPTPIQSLAIPPSLQARDVLGSAKTGSGKTLAFLLPLLERLYLLRWGPLDGLGAVVISPTRELAVQTFNQLREVGKYHQFSAGLVIGGKPLKEERERLGRMNILVATPGRLLQHLDSTVGFESAGVKVLVLDEADRLLDLGFLPALRAIVSHFSPGSTSPGARPDRQTLLFSATQSKDLAALAKLSLYDPLYVNCNKPGEEGVVPAGLEQFYAVIPLPKKLDALWGFVKSHLKMKGVVFVTSGKQVRFIFETFRRLHPGLPLMHLHGKQKQPTRLTIFTRFSSSKSALLICTDVAARGLDFPAVDWVVQLDCPDDVDTYVHRVGRTARYQAQGKALCMLCPSEEAAMLQRWKVKGVEVKNIKIKESKIGDLKQQMQNFAFKEPEIKYLGQRAFISYMRSVHFQKDKEVFKLDELPAEEFAASLGLPGAPQIKLGNTRGGGKVKERGGKKDEEEVLAVPQAEVVGSSDEEDEEGTGSEGEGSEAGGKRVASDSDEDSADEDEDEDEGSDDLRPQKAPAVRTKFDRMFERKNQSILAPHYSALVTHDDADDADEVFTLARRDHALDDTAASADLTGSATPDADAAAAAGLISSEDLSKRKLKLASTRKGLAKIRPGNEKVLFDDEGEATEFYKAGKDVEAMAGDADKRREFVERERERMRREDVIDREAAREKKREKKRKRKDREREVMGMEADDDESEGGGMAVIGGFGGSGDEGSYGSGADEDEEPLHTSSKGPKKQRRGDAAGMGSLEDEEELALRLLRG